MIQPKRMYRKRKMANTWRWLEQTVKTFELAIALGAMFLAGWLFSAVIQLISDDSTHSSSQFKEFRASAAVKAPIELSDGFQATSFNLVRGFDAVAGGQGPLSGDPKRK